MGNNLAQNPLGRPDRWLIDFAQMTLDEAESYSAPFDVIRHLVKPLRDTNRRDVTRIYWWRFGENAPKMRAALAPLDQFFAVGEMTKWAIFVPCEKGWLPGNKNKAVASDDFYLLDLLTSDVHRQWMHAQKGTLKGDIAYPMTLYLKPSPSPKSLRQLKYSRSARR